jgi:HAE1 family hydrophobic/amphiphilic exporter-1
MEVADALAKEVKALVENVGASPTRLSRERTSLEELLIPDRQKAENLKLTVSDVANALQTALSGTQAGFCEGGDEFAIMVKLRDPEKMSLRDILDLTVTNADGGRPCCATWRSRRPAPVPSWSSARPGADHHRLRQHQRPRQGSIIEDMRVALALCPSPKAFRSSSAATTRSSRRPSAAVDHHPGAGAGLHGDGLPV